MGVLTTGNTYSTADQVTASNLNSTVNDATFQSAAVDNTSTQLSGGAIIVKDEGITQDKIATSAVTTAKLATDSVSTAKIIDSNVTKAKIENFTNLTVLGNVSGSSATPSEVVILDEDNMASDSATSLSTQQSIKAYVDTQIGSSNELSEVLANGNTTGANNIIVTAAQSITTDTVSETTADAGVTVDSLLIKDGGITAAGTSTFAGQTISDLGTVTTANIDGGSIDGTTVGATTPAAVAATTISATGVITGGSLAIGTNDTTAGTISAYGDGAGSSEGGQLNLYIAADYHSTYNRWQIDAYEDDLRMFTNGGGEVIRVTPTGNLGIGTTAPANKLEVFGDDVRNVARASTTAGEVAVEAQAFDYWSGPTYTGTALKQSGSTATGTAAGLSNASLGGLYFQNCSAGLIMTNGATPIVFATTSAERMRIDSAGNVGIGITTPSTALQVVGGIRVGDDGNEDLILKRGTPAVTVGGSTAAGIITTTGTGAGSGHVGIEVPANDPDDGFYIATDSDLDGTVDNLAVKIIANGNVGIGTASPTEQLDLSGDAIRIRTAQTPASATATGTAGTVCWDASYIYVCTATNTWKRVAIATW
jgi:hypothetical protein